RADLRPNLQMHAVAIHRRCEAQSDAELLEHDADADVGVRPLDHRNRKFTAREEACFLSALGHEIGFGKALEQSLRLEQPNHHAEVIFLAEQKQIQEVAERELA